MIDFEKLREELIPHMRDGEGEVKARRFLDGEVKIMRLTLEENCSIGLHRHIDQCEVLYVLSGTASFTLDGKEEKVLAGQCHYCPRGSEHTVLNREREPLVMLAIIA